MQCQGYFYDDDLIVHRAERSGAARLRVDIESEMALYHHLDVLSQAGLVKESASKSGGKTRHFTLKEPKRPELAVLLFDELELASDPKGKELLLKAIEKLEGKPIPHRDKVVSAEIQLRYPWSK